MSGGSSDSSPLKGKGVSGEIKYSAIKVIINAIAQSSALIITNEFVRALGDKPVPNLMPYLYTAGFLSFAGREINKDNVKRVMEAMGAKADDKLIEALLDTKIENHLVYVYAFYYLLANGKTPTEASIGEIVKSLDIAPNPEAIKYVMKLVSAPWKFP